MNDVTEELADVADAQAAETALYLRATMVHCPRCFDWPRGDRLLCTICNGHGTVAGWRAVKYLEPTYMVDRRTAYVDFLQGEEFVPLVGILKGQAG